jgi:hypothetical protein
VARLRYVMDVKGLNRYARQSPELKSLIDRRAARGVQVAKALAGKSAAQRRPADTSGTEQPRTTPSFRDSIHTEKHPVRERYGMIYGVRIVADSRTAVWAEFGRKHKRAYDGIHALGRMADYLNAPHRSI